MKQEEFALALNALLPGCDPEASAMWAEFAARCVDHEQFVYFIPTEYHAAMEKWLDAFYAGLYAVKQEYGPEIATRVAVLGCFRCDLYPGEMMSAAEVLKNGGDAEQINAMRALGRLELNKPYFPDLPDEAALTCLGPEIGIARQIDGIINNEDPKPSLRDSLKHCQWEVKASQPVDAPGKPRQGQER